MPKSIGAVIYRKTKEGEFKFLLLHYPGTKKDYWGLVKGHTEKGEKEITTLKREIVEETGIKNLSILPNFRKEIRYFFQLKEKTIFKRVIFYLVKTGEIEVKISEEHIGYDWLNFEEAIKKITFWGVKKIFKKAGKYLNIIGDSSPKVMARRSCSTRTKS